MSSAVAIITALAPRPGHRLLETYLALEASRIDYQWLIQVDDESAGEFPVTLVTDPRVRIEANGQHVGIAATRNRALARAEAPLVLNADSDDVPVPGAIDRLAIAFEDSSVGLAFGDWIEHWPDRDPWIPTRRFTPGRLAPGTVSRIWYDERWVPFHLAGTMWRTDAVLAAGGWSAVLGGSDIGLLLGVDSVWAGAYVPGATFIYHHHASQATASDAWRVQFEHDMHFLRRRYEALRDRTPYPPEG